MAKLLKYKQTSHGFHGTSVYKLWSNIVKRCEVKSSSNYNNYGGRGIKICKKWRMNPGVFCKWALDNGYKKGLEIDRVNRNGNYSPSNCRFVTHKENCSPFKRVFKTSKPGYTGVSMSKCGTYEVYAPVNGKRKYIGVRKTIKDAVFLRNQIIGSVFDNPELLTTPQGE